MVQLHREYKTFFKLNSTEHDISTTLKQNKIAAKYRFIFATFKLSDVLFNKW